MTIMTHNGAVACFLWTASRAINGVPTAMLGLQLTMAITRNSCPETIHYCCTVPLIHCIHAPFLYTAEATWSYPIGIIFLINDMLCCFCCMPLLLHILAGSALTVGDF